MPLQREWNMMGRKVDGIFAVDHSVSVAIERWDLRSNCQRRSRERKRERGHGIEAHVTSSHSEGETEGSLLDLGNGENRERPRRFCRVEEEEKMITSPSLAGAAVTP